VERRWKEGSMALAVALSVLFAGLFLFAHFGLDYVGDLRFIVFSGLILGSVGGVLNGRALARKGKIEIKGWRSVFVNLAGLVLSVVPLGPLFFRQHSELRPLADCLQQAVFEEMALASSVFVLVKEVTYWREVERWGGADAKGETGSQNR
jgi:hypothetical protein